MAGHWLKRAGLKRAAVCAAMALALCAPAQAQNLALRGPAWAQPLLSTDITPTTGGRAALNEAGVTAAVRITIAPNQGGVARVVRYEARGDDATLAVRRFTGHPAAGWWLWGPDTPSVSTPTPAVRQELAGLIRAALALGPGALGLQGAATCPAGEQVFVEMALGGQSASAARACADAPDPLGRLVMRVSVLGGSRDEEELAQAAVDEVLAADRAFSAMSAAQGAGAAFARYAAADALVMSQGQPVRGHDAVAALYASWPAGARLEWTPEGGEVSSRGDMAWTWGRSAYAGPDGARREGRYVSVWTRDYEGNWRFAFDGGVGGEQPQRPR